VRAREAALLQLEPRLSQQRAESTGYVKALPAPSAISSERWRQAEEDLEKTKSSLASLKTEAVTQSSAIHGMTEQYESVRVALGAMQSGLLEVQQKQLKTTEVESLVTQARQELHKESLERKAENHQLSTQLLEHSERLEWAEQQRLKAESALMQDLLETKTELKREIREREEGQSQASLQLREEIGKREEAFEREVGREDSGTMDGKWSFAIQIRFSGTFEHCLSFEAGEEFKVLRWSKAGWWWAQRGVDNQQGWVYSAQMRPKMCTSCHEKVQNLPTPAQEQEMAEAEAAVVPEVEPWPPLPPTEDTPVWPPLPPGEPPKSSKAPREPENLLEGDYAQTLTFRNDGKVVPTGGEMNDHVLRQCEYYFNYQQWIDGQNAGSKKKTGKARLRLDGEERVEQKLQAAVREERRQRVQSELRFEGEDKGSGTLINVSAMEEQGRVRQQLLDLQARVASSEARQKTVESCDTFRTATLPLLAKFGIEEQLSFKILKRGAPPLGGGEVIFSCPIVKAIQPIELLNEGKVKRVRGVAYTTKVSPQAACSGRGWSSRRALTLVGKHGLGTLPSI
ncbi:unnamed protein product, partial [Durusdinium trenchii]